MFGGGLRWCVFCWLIMLGSLILLLNVLFCFVGCIGWALWCCLVSGFAFAVDCLRCDGFGLLD